MYDFKLKTNLYLLHQVNLRKHSRNKMLIQKQKQLNLLEQKKIQLKELQDKCQLQNIQKKIKLFRKQNEDLKSTVQQRNQADTNTLLQSKQLLTNNTKLEKTIQELKQQLKIAKKNSQSKNNNYSNFLNDRNQGKQSTNQITQSSKKKTISLVVSVRDITVTQNTSQIDIPNSQLQDQEFLQLQNFTQLKSIIVNDNLLTNESLKMVCKKMINLEKLNLANNKFQALSLQNINGLINLKVLDIRNNNLGDEAMKYICRLDKLGDLSCSKNKITDIGAEYLQNLKNLSYLDITNNQISGTMSFAKLQKLTHLYLMSNKLNKQGIVSLIKSTKTLKFLDVRFNVWNSQEKEQIKAAKTQRIQVFC